MALSLNKPGLLKVLNSQKALRIIQKNEGISRAELARLSGMSKPTVSLAIQNLLDRNLIMEAETNAVQMGRKAQGLMLNTSTLWFICILVDVHRCTIICATMHGEIPHKPVEFVTPENWTDFIACLKNAVSQMLAGSSVPPSGCAISMPGINDDSTGEIFYSPNIHFLDGKNVVAELKTAFSFPIIQVQEIRAIAIAAVHDNPADAYRNLLCVDIGEGVGGAVVVDRQVYCGSRHASGEIGHVHAAGNARPCGCGRTGCIETLLGAPGLHASFLQNCAPGNSTVDFIDACEKFPAAARETFFKALAPLVSALQCAVAVFDPDAVLVHGRVWEKIEGSVNHVQQELGPDVPVRYFARGRTAGLIASIFERIIIHNLEEDMR